METLRFEERASDTMPSVNIDPNERWLHLAGGPVLLGLSAIRVNPLMRLLMTAAGGMLLYQGVTGHSPMYKMAGINTAIKTFSRNASVPQQQGIRVEKSVIVNRSARELYAYWRNLENLPRIMRHLESVQVFDGRKSHWKVKAPVGMTVEWDAEVINEVQEQIIAWRSLPNAQIPNAGSVRFRPISSAGGADSTEVRVLLEYTPPAGEIGAALARLLGEEPSTQIEEDLRRFKMQMETAQTY